MNLLGNAQTLLGVLITLIVLCLFKNKSNFLRVLLFDNIVEDVKEQIRMFTKEISESKFVTSDPDNLAEPDFKRLVFLSDVDKHKNDLIETFKKIEDRKEMELIELHLLFLSIVIFIFDIFTSLTPEIELFFVLLTTASMIHTSCLWFRAFSVIEPQPQESSVRDLDKDDHMRTILRSAFYYVVIAILSMSVFFVPLSSDVLWLVQTFLIICAAAIHGRRKWEQMARKKYSYRFALKHAIIILIYPLVPAICMGMMLHNGWLYDWAIANGFTGLVNGLNIWCNHITEVYSHASIGGIFASYVAVYSFIIPVVAGYYVTRKYTKKCLCNIHALLDNYPLTEKDSNSFDVES